MNVSFKHIDDDNEWDSLVYKLPEYSFLNSSARYQYNLSVGINTFRYAVLSDNEFVGIITGNIGISKLFGRFLECKHSPMLLSDKSEYWEEIYSFVRELASKNKCFMFRFSPLYQENSTVENFYNSKGFIEAPTHNVDALISQKIDLTKDMEQLMRDMSKTRRNLLRRLLEDKEIEVKVIKDDSLFDTFAKFHEETVNLKGYQDKPTKLLVEELREQVSKGMCYMVVGYFNNEPISIWQLTVYGKNAHLYQACSSTEFREKNMIMTTLLYWRSVELAKSLGCVTFDLFGGVVPKEYENKKHPWRGVGEFKRSLGGEKITYMHSMDYPLERIKYYVYYLYSTIRTRMKGHTTKW